MHWWPCIWIILRSEINLYVHHWTISFMSITSKTQPINAIHEVHIMFFSFRLEKETCSNYMPWTTRIVDLHSPMCSMYIHKMFPSSNLTYFSAFVYKGGTIVHTYWLEFFILLNYTMYFYGKSISRISCFKCHQLSKYLDLSQPLINVLYINNVIMPLWVVDDVEGVINMMGNGDVMLWWMENVKHEDVKWCMGSVKCVTWKSGVV
jgi:hypothetical protein